MGNRELERGKADRNIFSGDLRGYAADCLFYVLDGKEYSRFFKLFWNFCFDFSIDLGHPVYARKARCEKNE